MGVKKHVNNLITPDKKSLMQKNSLSNVMGSLSKMQSQDKISQSSLSKAKQSALKLF
jgi:hypothetical protein